MFSMTRTTTTKPFLRKGAHSVVCVTFRNSFKLLASWQMLAAQREPIEIPQYVNKVIDALVVQFVRVPQVVIFPVATQRLSPWCR